MTPLPLLSPHPAPEADTSFPPLGLERGHTRPGADDATDPETGFASLLDDRAGPLPRPAPARPTTPRAALAAAADRSHPEIAAHTLPAAATIPPASAAEPIFAPLPAYPEAGYREEIAIEATAFAPPPPSLPEAPPPSPSRPETAGQTEPPPPAGRSAPNTSTGPNAFGQPIRPPSTLAAAVAAPPSALHRAPPDTRPAPPPSAPGQSAPPPGPLPPPPATDGLPSSAPLPPSSRPLPSAPADRAAPAAPVAPADRGPIRPELLPNHVTGAVERPPQLASSRSLDPRPSQATPAEAGFDPEPRAPVASRESLPAAASPLAPPPTHVAPPLPPATAFSPADPTLENVGRTLTASWAQPSPSANVRREDTQPAPAATTPLPIPSSPRESAPAVPPTPIVDRQFAADAAAADRTQGAVAFVVREAREMGQRLPVAVREKPAAPTGKVSPGLEIRPEIRVEGNGEKQLLTIGKQFVANRIPDVGTGDAEVTRSMSSRATTAASAAPSRESALPSPAVATPSSERAASGLGSAPLPTTPAPTAESAPLRSAAATMVREIANVIERGTVHERGTVELRLPSPAGDTLVVRLAVRGETVHTTFRTDSPELREWIAREWDQWTPRLADRGLRVAEPMFDARDTTGSSADRSATQGQSMTHQDSARHSAHSHPRAQREADENPTGFRPRRPRAAVPAAPAAARPSSPAPTLPVAAPAPAGLHTYA